MEPRCAVSVNGNISPCVPHAQPQWQLFIDSGNDQKLSWPE